MEYPDEFEEFSELAETGESWPETVSEIFSDFSTGFSEPSFSSDDFC